MKLEVLKEKKKQPYWDKWIRLYEIKRRKSMKNNVLDYFQKEEVNVDLPIAHAIKNIHLILCPNSNLNLIKKIIRNCIQKLIIG